jgi:hypothetical protein
MESGVLRGIVTAISSMSKDGSLQNILDLIWSQRYQINPTQYQRGLIEILWNSSTDTIGMIYGHGQPCEYRSVFGVPVGMHGGSKWSHSPATNDQIFALARNRNWVFELIENIAGMTPDSDVPDSAVMDNRTRELISQIEAFPGCRAHLLWGPPRSGKSVAAKQIACAIGGTWARVCGAVCKSTEVWRALDVLRPRALIIDDIDVNAGSESALMAGLERAREWARVIISTANVVPGFSSGSALRGAVIGRASDGKLIEYRELSPEVRRALAPDVSEDLDTHDLLAQFQVELQRRAIAYGTVTQDDVDELRDLQTLIGHR